MHFKKLHLSQKLILKLRLQKLHFLFKLADEQYNLHFIWLFIPFVDSRCGSFENIPFLWTGLWFCVAVKH